MLFNKQVILCRTLLSLGIVLGLSSGLSAQAWGAWTSTTAVVCDANDSEVSQCWFEGGIHHTNQVAEIWFIQKAAGGATISSTFVTTVAPTNQLPLVNIYLDVTWTHNSVSVYNNTPNTNSYQSAFPLGSFPEGYYEIEARIKHGGNLLATWTLVNTLRFLKGNYPPNAQINGNSGPQVTLLDGCINNEVLISTSSLCGDVYHLFVREVDPENLQVIGPEASRWLISGELNDLTGNGLNIKSFTGNGNTVVMTAGHTYQVALANNAFGGWKSVGFWVQMKAGDWDLVMHDNNTKDNGFEPWDQWDYDLFASPDLWNKRSDAANVNDGIHDIPDYVSLSGNTNKILVRVKNIGCETSEEDTPLRLFWTRARVGEYWDSHWLYDMTNNAVTSALTTDPYLAGCEITIEDPADYASASEPYLLPPIGPGQTWTMNFADGVEWFPPNPDHYDASNGGMTNTHPQLCLLARINEPGSNEDPISWEPTGTTDHIAPYVRNNNNVVTRNTILYNEPSFIVNPGNGGWNYGFTTVLVDNTSTTSQTLNLCIDQVFENDELAELATDFLEFGSIEIGMSEGLFDLWQAGGEEILNMEVTEETIFEVTEGAHACVNGITLEPGASEILGVRFNFSGEVFPEEDIPLRFDINPDYYEEGVQGSANIIQLMVPAESPLEQNKRGSEGVENDVVSSIQIFPNPASQVLNIYYGSDQEESVETFDLKVINMAGQVVLSKESLKKNTRYPINIEDLKAGVYLVELKAGAQVTTERLVIE